jgi:hypothetical protein
VRGRWSAGSGLPPRSASLRGPIARLSRRLTRAVFSLAMQQIDFSDEDVDAILAYLYALAIKK